MSLSQQIILITGASEGIGAALSKVTAARNATVIAVARQLDKLEELAAGSDGKIMPFALDLQNASEIDRLFEVLERKELLPDILVNNAGVSRFEHTEDLDVADWDRMMAVNLRAPFLMMRGAIPHMKAQRSGTIINLNSVAGKQAFRNAAGYCASKYGLTGLTDVVREELRKFNIRVIGFHPGAVASSWWEKVPDSDNLPYDRMLTVEDVVKAIVNAMELPAHAVSEEVVLRFVGGNF